MDRKMMALVPLCAALTAAGAFIKLPLWPVPITLQTFFVVFSGIILGPRYGPLSQIVYIIMGLLGLPVFSGGGGPAYIMRPSFGYLMGFVAAPLVVGHFVKDRALTHQTVFIAALLGTLVIYCIGTPYLAVYMKYVMNKPEATSLAIKTGALIFIPGDLIKCLVLALVVPRIRVHELLKR